jgi:2-methylcitrate dehydratase PrpD
VLLLTVATGHPARPASITERWCERVLAKVTWIDLPPEVQTKVKLTLLDGLGVMIYVSSLEETQRLFAVAAGARAEQDGATILGLPGLYEPGMAAFVNGAMLHGFEIDDTDLRSYLHPSAVQVPAALAEAETRSKSGRDLLVSLVVGYQVAQRLAHAVNPLPEQPLQRGGFMPTSVVGAFGAAAAAARLRGLSARGMVDAMGLAGSQSFGLMTYGTDGSDEKALHAGRAAQAALFSAGLAAAGFRGPERVLEAPRGFFAGHDLTVDEEVLLDGFERMDEILYVTPKRFSCSHSTAPYLDAIEAWEREHGEIDSHGIERLEARVVPRGAASSASRAFTEPRSRTAAQLNPAVVVATYLIEGDVFTSQWEEDAHRDPQVLALARRFESVPSVDGSSRLRIHMADGRVHDVPVEFRYDAPYPADREEAYRSKFRRLTTRTLGAEEVEKVISSVLALDSEADVAELMRSLGKRVAAGRSAPEGGRALPRVPDR